MRRLAYIVCTLFSLGLLLGPATMLHAHVPESGREQVSVHGGHGHQLADDHGYVHAPADHHDEHASDRVLDLQLDSTQGGSSQPWVKWVALMVSVALLILTAQPLTGMHPLTRLRSRPTSPYPHPLPLLRGPPLSI